MADYLICHTSSRVPPIAKQKMVKWEADISTNTAQYNKIQSLSFNLSRIGQDIVIYYN